MLPTADGELTEPRQKQRKLTSVSALKIHLKGETLHPKLLLCGMIFPIKFILCGFSLPGFKV